MSDIGDKIAAAFTKDAAQYTAFLSMSEISDALRSVEYSGIHYALWGGYEDAERKVFGFSAHQIPFDFPITILMGELDRFGSVTHRDVLGSVMSSGIERKCIGDILTDPEKNTVYLCILSHMAKYIMEQVTSIGRCSVRWKICDDPGDLPETRREERRIPVSSLRIDCVIAAVYGLSRNAALELIQHGSVFSDHSEIVKPTVNLSPGASVSVRGYGKFIFADQDGMSKKGKTYIKVKIYK